MPTTKTQSPFKTRDEFLANCKRHNIAFLAANPKRVVIEYVREIETLRPTAVLVGYRADDGQLRLGWSASNPKKERHPFDKAEGVWRAIRRATGEGRTTAVIPDRVLSHFKRNDFMARAAEETGAKY
jgi:hypothetical protein